MEADGTLHSRALAHDDAASEEIQEAEKAAFRHTVIRWGSFGFGGGRMTKNLPLKRADHPFEPPLTTNEGA